MRYDLAIRNSAWITSMGTYATRQDAEDDAIRAINEVNRGLGNYFGYKSVENIVIVEFEEK